MITLLLASALEIYALVDSLDFASIVDIEKDAGTIQVLEHVLGTYPTGLLWRDKSGGQVRYPSPSEKSVYCENPLNKLQYPRCSVYGDLRQHNRCTNVFDRVREECLRRGIEFGMHVGWEDSHAGVPWTESNWLLAHPQFASRSKDGPIRIASASVGHPEVLAHKLELMDERLAYRPTTIFLDMRRGGGWGPRYEYTAPIVAQWRKRYACEPPADCQDDRWIALVSEYITDYLKRYKAKCNAQGAQLLVGFDNFAYDDTNGWKNYALDWKQLATNNFVDGIVIMNAVVGTTNTFERAEEILRHAKANCGTAKLYFHASMYGSATEGIPCYVQREGVTHAEAARRLLEIAERTGCAGSILTCVDYKNYYDPVCEALSEHSRKTGGKLKRWVTSGSSDWYRGGNWADGEAANSPTNVVEFRASAAVNLNTNAVTEIARMAVRGFSSAVSLDGDEGASLHFTAPAGATTPSDVGIDVDSGSSLTVKVPISASGAFALAGFGEVKLKSTLTAETLTLGMGQVTLDGGTISAGSIQVEKGGLPLKVASGRIEVAQDCSWNDLQLDAPENLTLTATNPVVVRLPDGFLWPAALAIGTNVTLRIGSGIRTWARSATPPNLCLKAGGRLELTDFNSYLNTPVDLTIENGGQIYLGGRIGVVAHRLEIAGEVKLPGCYAAVNSEGAAIAGQTSGGCVMVPYTWQGSGDGTGWHDPLNWEGGEVPPVSTPAPVDFSRMTNATILVTNEVAVSFFAYLPPATNVLTICAANDRARFKVRGKDKYFPVACVTEDSRVSFDVDVENLAPEQLNVVNGHGAVRFTRALVPLDPQASTTAFWLIEDGALEIAGTLQLENFCAARNGEVASEVVFLDGAQVDVANVLCANYSGYTNLERLRQEGGSVNAGSLYVMTYRPSDTRMRYTLNGGELSLEDGLYLGAKNPCFKGDPLPGGDFVMTGGTLRTPRLSTELNNNWYRLTGGEIHLGAGGIVKGEATLAKALPNATPGLEFGGVTFVATNSWSSAESLEIALTGEGGAAVFDLAEGMTVTLAGPIGGAGGIRKRGQGTLRFGRYAGSGVLAVEAGSVELAESDDLSSTELYVQSRESVTVPEGADLTVARLYVKGIVKPTGTYRVNGGTITVLYSDPPPLTIGEAANAPELEWFTEGSNELWYAEWSECAADERHAVRSGAIGHGAATTLGVRFSGKGTFYFDWKTSSEAKYDAVRLEVDGAIICPLSGESDWRTMSVDLDYDRHEIRWIYQKNRSVSTGEDAAWIDNVRWELSPDPTLSEALNNDSDLVWETGGDVGWEAVRTLGAYAGRACAVSGLIGDLGATWLQTGVSGAGHLEFWWATSCEEGFDWCEFSVDGEIRQSLSGETDWTHVALDLTEGEHILRWEYWKDDYTDAALCGADCALLDYVSWVPVRDYLPTDVGTVELSEFYEWLSSNRLVSAAALPKTRMARKALATSLAGSLGLKGAPLAAEYIAGTDPGDSNSVFAATITLKDGQPVVDCTPTVTGRRYRIWGSDDLKNWSEVTSPADSGYHFFKVSVELAP